MTLQEYDFSHILKGYYPFIDVIKLIKSSENTFWFKCKNKLSKDEYTLEIIVSTSEIDGYKKVELYGLPFQIKFQENFGFSNFINSLIKHLKKKYPFTKTIELKSDERNSVLFTVKNYFYEEEYEIKVILSDDQTHGYEEIKLSGFTFQVKFLEPMSYFILCRLKDNGIKVSDETKEGIRNIVQVSNQKFFGIDENENNNSKKIVELSISQNIGRNNIVIKNSTYETLCVVNIKYIYNTLHRFLEDKKKKSQTSFINGYLEDSKLNTKNSTNNPQENESSKHDMDIDFFY